MDKGVVDLIINNLNGLKEDLRLVELNVEEKVERLDAKVEQLLRFKWQIVGGSVVMSILFTAMFQILLSLIERGGS